MLRTVISIWLKALRILGEKPKKKEKKEKKRVSVSVCVCIRL